MADLHGDNNALMFALDMGTTTLEGQLVDKDGHIRAHTTVFNPQQKFGQDIIRRLEHATTAQGIEQLREALMQGVAEVFIALCRDAGVEAAAVERAVAAGNSAVSVLARGGDGATLLRPPYRPESCAGVNLEVPELEVPLYLLPLVGVCGWRSARRTVCYG